MLANILVFDQVAKMIYQLLILEIDRFVIVDDTIIEISCRFL